MKHIKLTQFEHRGVQQMGIRFDYDDEVRHYIKELSAVKWSQTYKTFYVPLNSQNKSVVNRHLRKKNGISTTVPCKTNMTKHLKKRGLQAKNESYPMTIRRLFDNMFPTYVAYD